MDFKKTNKIFQSSTKALAELNGKLAADASEYLLVIDELELALEESKEDQVINWYAREIALQPGSSIYEIYNPGRLLLNDFLQKNFVIGMINRVGRVSMMVLFGSGLMGNSKSMVRTAGLTCVRAPSLAIMRSIRRL